MARRTRIVVQFSPAVLAWLDGQGVSRSRAIERLILDRMAGEKPRENIRLRELAARVNAES